MSPTPANDGLARIIEGHIQAAQWLAAQIDATPGWQRLAPVPFSTVCFCHRRAGESDREAHNAAIVEAVNASGKAFVSHTKLNGQYAIRVAIGDQHTRQAHIEQLWVLLRQAAG